MLAVGSGLDQAGERVGSEQTGRCSERGLDGGNEFVRAIRFAEEAHRSIELGEIAAGVARREENASLRVQFDQVAECVAAGHARHGDVEDHE